MTPRILFGVDRVCALPARLGAASRVGLVTNDAARLASDRERYARVALLDAGIPVVRLFGPEHGLSATAADGTAVADACDPVTGLPVLSLYGQRLRPTMESLRDLDAVLFDVPDVGARFYTYTWTLYHMLAACTEASVPLVVLDRPNPHGGELTSAEGPVMDMSCRSFLGEHDIPIRHQLTLGELARLWQREHFVAAALRVIPCDGLTRAMQWPDTGLPWVPTSPAMPTWPSAAAYPGACLFEATNLSVGRGTSTPFQQVGAPWLDVAMVADDLRKRGIACTETGFSPTLAPYRHEPCRGLRVHADAVAGLGPVALHLLLMASVARTHRGQFTWATYPTAANPEGHGHFERLIGRPDIRAHFDAAPERIDVERVRTWTSADTWAERVRPALLYE